MTTIKPFLKWVGGKTQIIDQIMSKFPHAIHDYYEPFVGGGSVLLSLLQNIESGRISISGCIYATDNNKHLIWTYRNIQRNVDDLINELSKLSDLYNQCETLNGERNPHCLDDALKSKESIYYLFRREYNEIEGLATTSIRASALFIFLNKTCFRGLYREGPNGFNVAFGNYNNPHIYDAQHLRGVSKLIQCVHFIPCEFHEALVDVNAGDFVYLDPPYVPVSKTSFVQYNGEGFSQQTHELLFRLCNKMVEHGVYVLMSNADAEIIYESFPATKFCVVKIQCKRTIHSKKPNTVATEVLVTSI
jgi:DNA adenine methylase